MSVFFIADLHLDAQRPDSIRAFSEFISKIHSAKALYILGDFVEYWLGDDDNEHLLEPVFDCAASLCASGVPIYFMHGNRDFLIGERFLRQHGMELLADPTVIDLYGQKTLLMHGDLLCTDDHEYQKFRHTVRNPEWQAQFLEKPLAERRAIAVNLRQTSKQASQGKSQYTMDVNQTDVSETIRKHGAQRLIHGHTHKPGIHRFNIDSTEVERIVLGDWYQQKTSILKFDEMGYKLIDINQLSC